MRNWFSIENKAEGATVYIYDEIGAFGITASQFVEQLAEIKASTIALRINSPGGNVFEGVTIHNALRRHSATVTTFIDGVAASIASVVALAGNKVRIAENAFFMIHDPFALVVGTAEDMRKAAQTLDQVAQSTIISAYLKKTGASEKQVKEWMAVETWFTADEALEAGFVDAVDASEDMKNSADISKFNFKHLPAKIAARIRTAPAATGTEPQPGASGKPVKAITSPPKAKGQMTIKDQITQFENTRASKAAARDELMKSAAEKGETLDAAQAEQYDTLQSEIVAIDQHLGRLREQEKENAASAAPVDGVATATASASRSTTPVVVARDEKLGKGIEFARFAMCLAAAKGNIPQALALAETHYPKQTRAIGVLKAAVRVGTEPDKLIANLLQMQAAAVPAGTTEDATWAGPLLEYNTFAGDFVEYLRPRTLLGRFGSDGIPDLRRIPFNVHIKARTSGGSAKWVGQGKAKPVTKYDYLDAYHGFAKIATIAVLAEEVIRFSNPSAEANVREALSETIIAKMDSDFVDPDVAAVANVNPASITNGVASINSSGDDADAVRADLAALWASPIAANLPLTSAVYITTPSVALSLSLMTNPLGQPEFPDMTMMGGTLRGVKVIVSNYVPAGLFILAFASEIYLSDDGIVTIDASREASIEMDDAPAGDSDTPTPAQLVSMFQTNSVALRAERFVNWSKRRTTAVSLLRNVGWGGAIES